jgi:flagellar hook protein FlgE
MKSPKTKYHLFPVALTFFAAINIIAIARLSAQSDSDPLPTPAPTPPPLSASGVTIYFGPDDTAQPKKHDGKFAQVAITAGQTVTISLQYDTAISGQAVVVDSLDGGEITMPEEGLHVDETGVVTFQYQAGETPGLCRIVLHQAGDGDTVQFWVIDTSHPGDNPPSLPEN